MAEEKKGTNITVIGFITSSILTGTTTLHFPDTQNGVQAASFEDIMDDVHYRITELTPSDVIAGLDDFEDKHNLSGDDCLDFEEFVCKQIESTMEQNALEIEELSFTPYYEGGYNFIGWDTHVTLNMTLERCLEQFQAQQIGRS